MIRINLLHEKRPKRADKGQKVLAIGLGVVILEGGALFGLLHLPMTAKIEEAAAVTRRIQETIKKLTEETADFDAKAAEFAKIQAQSEAIKRLNNARAVPAWMLREISQILTRDKKPTMTEADEERVKTDRNRQWAQNWDPKRVWIDEYTEKEGKFTIKGGAQLDSDVTQFAYRLQASVFFKEVQQETAELKLDPNSRLSYYDFSITGKMRY